MRSKVACTAWGRSHYSPVMMIAFASKALWHGASLREAVTVNSRTMQGSYLIGRNARLRNGERPLTTPIIAAPMSKSESGIANECETDTLICFPSVCEVQGWLIRIWHRNHRGVGCYRFLQGPSKELNKIIPSSIHPWKRNNCSAPPRWLMVIICSFVALPQGYLTALRTTNVGGPSRLRASGDDRPNRAPTKQAPGGQSRKQTRFQVESRTWLNSPETRRAKNVCSRFLFD